VGWSKTAILVLLTPTTTTTAAAAAATTTTTATTIIIQTKILKYPSQRNHVKMTSFKNKQNKPEKEAYNYDINAPGHRKTNDESLKRCIHGLLNYQIFRLIGFLL